MATDAKEVESVKKKLATLPKSRTAKK